MRFPKVSTTNINGLPLGYTEVEYLESTGTQYINTGINGNVNIKLDVLFSKINSSDSNIHGILGARGSSANSQNISVVHSGTGLSIDFNNSNYATYRYPDSSSESNVKYRAIADKNARTLYREGVLHGSNTNFCTDTISTTNIWMFGLENYYKSNAKIYYAKIWENNTLVRDFIPCLDSNNIPCMYDKVEGKAYYNLGTDEFTYGKKIYGVEYLESTGTQYINTGCILSSDCKGEALAEYTGVPSSGSSYIFGTYGGSKNFGINADLVGNPKGFYGVWYNQGIITSSLITPQQNVKYKVEVSSNGIYINDTLFSNVSGTFTGSNPAYLFWANGTGQPKSLMKLYWTKFWDGNGILTRDFIPCKDENNVGYMFDRLSHSLYENKGTGAFIIGKDTLGKSKVKLIRIKTTVSGLPYGFTEVEYLEGNGNQYIDTGIQPTDTYGYRVRNTYTAGGGEQCAIGCMDSNNRFVGIYTNGSANGISGAWGDYVGFLPSYTWTTGTILDVKGNYKNNRKLIIDSTEMKDISDTHISGTIENTVYLFARHYGSTITKMRGRIYSAEITNGQDVINKFIPALDSSNRPCMYDIIEGKAYYNQGTGEFTYGPKIIPVEYLESTGTQYIDTGLKGKNGYDFAYKFNSKIDDNAYGIGGEWESGKSCYLGVIRNNNKFAYHYKDTSSPIEVQTLVNNTDYEVQAHLYAGEQYYVINGTKSTIGTISGTFTSTVNMCLFAVNSSTTKTFSNLKMYFCKIWDDGTIVRDYIPVKDENNVGYMFDKLNHTLYANAGTGSFVVGDEKVLSKVRFIEDTSVISEYTKVKCLISSGTQYIDTGFKPNNNTKIDLIG